MRFQNSKFGTDINSNESYAKTVTVGDMILLLDSRIRFNL